MLTNIIHFKLCDGRTVLLDTAPLINYFNASIEANPEVKCQEILNVVQIVFETMSKEKDYMGEMAMNTMFLLVKNTEVLGT